MTARADTRPALALALALTVAGAAHSGALFGGFVWDDHALIETKESVHALQPLTSYFTQMFWSDPLSLEARNFYRPLVSLSFTLDWRRGGGEPFAFHLTNLLAHLACVALLFGWLRRSASAVTAGLLSAAWSVFPRLTESVSWISGRTDVFATLGVLGALVLWPFEDSKRATARRVLAAGCLLAGLFSKEVAAAGLVALAFAHLWRRRPWVQLAPLGVAAVVYAAARFVAQQRVTEVLELGAWRPVFTLQALGTYAVMVLDGLRPSVAIGLLGVLDVPRLVVGVLVVLALGVGARRWTPDERTRVGVLGAVVGLALVLHVLPLPIRAVACDRFLYLPLALGCTALAASLERHAWARWLAAVVVVLWGSATWLRVQAWNDELTLFADEARRADPRDALPVEVLADVLLERHFAAQAVAQYHRAFEAEQRFDAARVGPTQPSASPQGRLNLAVALEELGQWNEAGALFDELVGWRPRWPRVRYGRVLWALRQHDWARATTELEEADRLLGASEVSSRLRAALEKTRAEEQRLPAEQPDEVVDLARRRIALASELGGVFELNTRWSRLVVDPRCDAACQQEGLAYLVVQAPPLLAGEALRTVKTRSTVPPKLLSALEAALAAREAELVAATAPGR
jgi:tetratricopeptide (TPR) repeat protein